MERNTDNSMSRRSFVIRAWMPFATVAALGAIASFGCLQINDDHCIAKAGDFHCTGDEICTMSYGRTPERSVNGCAGQLTSGLVHVKYGLPETFEAFLSDLKMAYPMCPAIEAQEQALQEAYNVLNEKVIKFLNGRRHVSTGSIELKPTIDGFTMAVNAVVEGCPPAGETGISSGTDGPSVTDSSESSTTGPMPCTMDEQCSAARPFCDDASGECVRCDETTDPDVSCLARDPSLPLCVEGECVACTIEDPAVCDAKLMACDDATHACVPCTEHEQCASGACELVPGRCFPSDVVVHVDGDGGRDFTRVGDAVAAVSSGAQGVIIVHELDDEDNYVENVLIDGARRVALLAASGEVPTIQGFRPLSTPPGVTLPAVWVRETAVVYIDRIRIADGVNVRGLHVNGAFVRLDRSEIVQNTGRGVVAENVATVELRNTIVGGNGDAPLNYESMGVDVVDSTVHILYSTVANNLDVVGMNDGNVDSIRCHGSSTVTVRNSIVVGSDPGGSIDCPGIVITNSALDAAFGGNIVVGPAQDSWFTDPAAGNFRLSSMGVSSGAATFVDIAQWTIGDPTTDIDGDPRPGVEGMPDYAGADVP